MNKIALKEQYELFVDTFGEVVDYKTYSKVIKEINKEFLNLLLDGKSITVGRSVGKLQIKRFERVNFNQPNWGESNKRKQEIIDRGGIPKDKDNPDGEDWVVYFVDDTYLKFDWQKYERDLERVSRAKNSTFYVFTPMFHARRSLGEIKNKDLIEVNYDKKYK